LCVPWISYVCVLTDHHFPRVLGTGRVFLTTHCFLPDWFSRAVSVVIQEMLLRTQNKQSPSKHTTVSSSIITWVDSIPTAVASPVPSQIELCTTKHPISKHQGRICSDWTPAPIEHSVEHPLHYFVLEVFESFKRLSQTLNTMNMKDRSYFNPIDYV
jgi:hypothetical protein